MQINSLVQIYKYYQENGNLPAAPTIPMRPDQVDSYRQKVNDLYKEAQERDNSNLDFNLESGQVACLKGANSYTCVFNGSSYCGNLSAVRSKSQDKEFLVVDAQPAAVNGLRIWWDQHGPVVAQAFHLDRERPDLCTLQEIGWVHGFLAKS